MAWGRQAVGAALCQTETLPDMPSTEARQAGQVLQVLWEFLAQVQDSWHWAGVRGTQQGCLSPLGLVLTWKEQIVDIGLSFIMMNYFSL